VLPEAFLEVRERDVGKARLAAFRVAHRAGESLLAAGELPELGLGHHGPTQRGQRQVFLVALQALDVGPGRVQELEDRLGEVVAVEVLGAETPGLLVIGEDRLDVLVGQGLRAVLDQRAGDMVRVVQLVVGDDL